MKDINICDKTPLELISYLREKLEESNVKDISSDVIRKVFKKVIYSRNDYALSILLSLLQRYRTHSKLQDILNNIFENDVEFFCKTICGYINAPFGGGLPLSPQGLLLQQWILSPSKNIQNLKSWIEQIKNFSTEGQHLDSAFYYLGRHLGLSPLVKKGFIQSELVEFLNSEEWFRKGFLQRFSISKRAQMSRKKLLKFYALDKMHEDLKKVKNAGYLQISSAFEKTIEDINNSTGSGKEESDIPEIKNLIKKIHCFYQKISSKEFCVLFENIKNEIKNLLEKRIVKRSYLIRLENIKKSLLDEVLPLYLFLKNNQEKFDRIKYEKDGQYDAIGYYDQSEQNKIDIEITTAGQSKERADFDFWQREHTRLSLVLANNPKTEELAQCVESEICCCPNGWINEEQIKPRIFSKVNSFENALEKKLRKGYTSKPLLIVYIKFDSSFLILSQNHSSDIKKEFVKNLQQEIDSIPQSKKGFKEIFIVAEDGNNGLAECIWKTSEKDDFDVKIKKQ